MEYLQIEGGSKLFGEIRVSGMKNSALPVIFATVLIKDECIIENVPRVSDVFCALDILTSMGARVEWCEKHSVLIDTSGLCGEVKEYEKISKMRASSYLMGVLLARFGSVKIPMPGGCNFGGRPIEQHLKGFSLLGAECKENGGFIEIYAKKHLKSTKITLDKISVGATINIVLASVLLDGVTTIDNCAIEPHVDDVICFLNRAGAKVIRKGRRIYCEGVSSLHGVKYRIFPDMIEALTYFTMLGATCGDITLTGVNYEHLSYSAIIFQSMGMCVDSYYDEVRLRVFDRLSGARVVTAPYPFFPTDLHPQFAAMLCFTKDGGEVREEIFPSRFAYISELERMGANITKSNNVARVLPSELHAASTYATDLRAGAALVVGALGASGQSTINNVNYIVRGYEDLTGKISSLGGKIKLLKGE